jgi:hypothetical protein
MDQFAASAYGPVFAPLLSVDRRRPLDAGSPEPSARSELALLSIETAFAHEQIVDCDMATCCIAGVWLLHDYLDESHTISQSIETPSGSFWHAIMHRREGDFSNAKYWLRRVGRHPVLDAIGMHLAAPAAADANSSFGETRLREAAKWDPFAFVDLCEAALRGNREDREQCLDIQQVEWELLFDHCYAAAIDT